MISHKCCGLSRRQCVRYFVIEEADPEDVLHAGRSVSHAKVPQRVPHQDDVGVFLQLLEVLRVPQGTVVFVVHVDQLTFEAPDNALSVGGKIQPARSELSAPELAEDTKARGLTLSSKSMKLETTLTLEW